MRMLIKAEATRLSPKPPWARRQRGSCIAAAVGSLGIIDSTRRVEVLVVLGAYIYICTSKAKYARIYIELLALLYEFVVLVERAAVCLAFLLHFLNVSIYSTTLLS